MTEAYRLHYFPESGNSYKLAQMLTLCEQPFDLVWTDFGGRVTWTEGWRRKMNPMGEVPVLEENGTRLTQTGPILLHLAEKFGRLLGGEARLEVLRWLFGIIKKCPATWPPIASCAHTAKAPIQP